MRVEAISAAIALAMLADPASEQWTPPRGARAPGFVQTDLRSFFHGDARPPKAPPPETRATVSTHPGMNTDPQVESFLRALADGLMARDAKGLLPRLSEKYAITGLPSGQSARDTFAQAVERIPGPLEMNVQSVTIEKGDRIAVVEFRMKTAGGVEAKRKTFRFDAEGKLLASDLFAIRVERHV